ncbi:HEPN domain-containing protein [Clostridium butyricum]|uniref:HEPN domain-containing protein n=1 Tax=Clostridium butyricum TaxID=1492 RepID=UPI001F57755D|nr:MAE_28990/MAE_18760 family HEPN-like nuclease [Clostridium butyricum]
MDDLLNEFISDLKSINQLIDLIEILKASNSIKVDDDIDATKYKSIIELHKKSTECTIPLTILPGTLFLYLGGRFEYFVKNIFEETCSLIANLATCYSDLPREMKKNLIDYTAEVVANPRKYGHADKGIASFIKNLSKNINNDDITNINASCLSITYENMRADTLNSLFERIGLKNVLQTISEQTDLKLCLRITNNDEVNKFVRKYLNEFMDIRNMIAHPSKGITWPDSEKIRFYLTFFENIAKALINAVKLYLVSIEKKAV